MTCAPAGRFHEVCLATEDGAYYAEDFGEYERFDFYGCFEDASCELQGEERCGWAMTPALAACLARSEGRAAAAELPVDFHVHVGVDDGGPAMSTEQELGYVANLPVSQGLIISSTYNEDLWSEASLDELVQENERVLSHLAESSGKDRFGLLCGVDIHRDDAVELARRCLDLPGVRGIKLRGVSLESADELRTFERLVEAAAAHEAMVLTHFSHSEAFDPGDDYDALSLTGEPATTEQLLTLMVRHPQAKLIIAHSGYNSFVGLDGLAWLGRQFAENPQWQRNIYMELSASIVEEGHERPDFMAPTFEAWRSFGMDWVLFGSDYIGGPSTRMGLEQRVIEGTALLSADEKRQILRTNAARILPPSR